MKEYFRNLFAARNEQNFSVNSVCLTSSTIKHIDNQSKQSDTPTTHQHQRGRLRYKQNSTNNTTGITLDVPPITAHLVFMSIDKRQLVQLHPYNDGLHKIGC